MTAARTSATSRKRELLKWSWSYDDSGEKSNGGPWSRKIRWKWWNDDKFKANTNEENDQVETKVEEELEESKEEVIEEEAHRMWKKKKKWLQWRK